MHLLIIDDEPDIAFLFKQHFRKQLRENIFTFTFAGNGREALDLITDGLSPDLILTDLNMPEMDGISFLQEISAMPIFAQLKAIVISAYGDMGKIRAAMNTGAFDFITKPIDFEDLEKTLKKAQSEVELVKESKNLKAQLITTVEEKDKAVQSEKFKQQFLANMSHEIRTPMNAIIGMTRLTLNTNLNEIQLKYLKGIQSSAENLLVIINDILDFSKIEAGKMDFESIPFQVSEVMQHVADILKFKAEEKGLALKVDILSNVPTFVKGDPVRLHQILLNLAGNAVKFTENGEVCLHVAYSPPVLHFEIRDTGIGIAPDQVKKVFESFSQAQADTTRKFGGTGLGLTITRELVTLQGGQIGVNSTLGKGSTFWVDLPYEQTEGEVKSEKSEMTLPSLENISILLVEDNAFNQMVATDTLEELIPGVNVTVAENGQLALDAIKNAKSGSHFFPFHVVLMDVQMPVMDGFEATRQIRALTPPLSQIPIIALTANAIKEEVEKCKDCGMNDFVTKPFDPQILLTKIQQYI